MQQQSLQIIVGMQATYAPPSSNDILQAMRKRPYSQLLQGQEITYSVLCKKQKTFLFGNDRFLLLRGIDSLSYAREFPQHQRLPFSHPAELPPPKSTLPLSEIQHFSCDQELLTVQFSGDKKVRWDFVCPSNTCAQEWRRKLQLATKLYLEYTLSGCTTHEEFFRSREAMSRQGYQQQPAFLGSESPPRTRNLSSLSSASNRMQPYTPIQPNITGNMPYSTPNQQLSPARSDHEQHLLPVTNLDANTAAYIARQLPKQLQNGGMNTFGDSPLQQKQIRFENTQENKGQLSYSPSAIFNNNQRSKIHNENNNNSYSPIEGFKEVDRPILFQASKMAKIEDLAAESKWEDELRYRSISHLSYSQKEKIKADIGQLRRSWIEELLAGQEIVSLVIDFQKYSQRIAEVIINELHVPKELRIYPVFEQSKEHAVYLQDDIHVEIYFYSEEHLISKNPRYKNAVMEFKNLDYLLGVTRNEGIFKVPLMMLFEFKGFLGMARMRVDNNGHFANKQLYQTLDRKSFQSESKICAQSLLDERHCKIVKYEGHTSLSRVLNNSSKAYFVQKLTKLLPLENKSRNSTLLRPEFVQDEQIDEVVFGDEARQMTPENIGEAIDRKIVSLLSVLQNEKEYFTNSKQLSDLVHYFGLNMRHIGAIYTRTHQSWLKRCIREDIIGRCLKNYFRFDVQNIVQLEEKEKSKERQAERQRNRAISFLNIIFGNTETTFRIWRNLNSFAQENFNIKIWQGQFQALNLNVNYLYQAVQNHLKIVLTNNAHDRKPFQSMSTFQPQDFIRFQFDSTIYNLEFSDIFEEIHECLDEQTFESFHNLCEVLTKQTPSKATYFQTLRSHPINQKIREFLLQFTSPHDNNELYHRIQESHLPSRLLYESKLAEIKWYLKSGKLEEANRPISFMLKHLNKWLGDVHPLFTTLNRLLAEYYLEQQLFYGSAIKYAQASLDMQLSLFGGQCAYIWKDYFLIGKIHFLNNRITESLTFLTKAKGLVDVQKMNEFQVYGDLCLMLAKGYLTVKYFKEAYTTTKELYKLIRNERDERSLAYIIEAVTMIKQLLDINQEHESFQRFVESDFSEIAVAFADYPILMSTCIRLIAIPNLKNTLLRNSANRGKLLGIIDAISAITQSANSCISFIKAKMVEGAFPRNYQQCLKDIDSVIEEIEQNQMLERWKSFNKMANEAILDKISGSINRGFEFMAYLTAIFNLLGPDVLGQLSIMEK